MALFDARVFITRTQKAVEAMRHASLTDRHEPIAEALELLEGSLVLAASIADSLQRIAAAQEDMAAIARVDINATIDEEVKARLEPEVEKGVAHEMEKRTKRSFIGQPG